MQLCLDNINKPEIFQKNSPKHGLDPYIITLARFSSVSRVSYTGVHRIWDLVTLHYTCTVLHRGIATPCPTITQTILAFFHNNLAIFS